MAREDTAGPESGIQIAGIVILLAVHTVLILNQCFAIGIMHPKSDPLRSLL